MGQGLRDHDGGPPRSGPEVHLWTVVAGIGRLTIASVLEENSSSKAVNFYVLPFCHVCH